MSKKTSEGELSTYSQNNPEIMFFRTQIQHVLAQIDEAISIIFNALIKTELSFAH